MCQYEVFGEITIPIKYTINASGRNVAIKAAEDVFKGVLGLDGDLYLSDGKIHTVIAKKLTMCFYDAKTDDEL